MGQARPVTASGRVAQALGGLLPPQTLPCMQDAVRRASTAPGSVAGKKAHTAKNDAHYTYRYTRSELGEVLALAWWAHRMSKRKSTSRDTVRQAVEVLSVLRLFSAPHLAALTGIASSTVTKWMVPVPSAPASRVLGTCSTDVLRDLLDASADGMAAYRQTVTLFASAKVPAALLSRISGVPRDLLKKPDKGEWFYPQECDISHGAVVPLDAWASYHRKRIRKDFDPRFDVDPEMRLRLGGSSLAMLRTHQAAVPLPGETPFHMRIGGLTRGCPGGDAKAHGTIRRWEQLWGIRALDDDRPGHLRNCPCEEER
jgi:hypothetical protein